MEQEILSERECFRLYNSDCLKKLDELNSNSVHLVITDPPYFIDGMGDDWDDTKLNNRVKEGVIKGLPSGMKFDTNQALQLELYMTRVFRKIYSVLMPGGFAAVFSFPRLSFSMGSALDNVGFEIRDMLIWKRDAQTKAFSQDHFVKKMKISDEAKKKILKQIDGKKTPQLRPQFECIQLAQKPKEGTYVENWLKYKVGLMSPNETLFEGFPGNIIDVPKEKNGEINHFTVKPVKVMQQLIRLFSSEGQTVLDPFMGSGTTGLAALEEKRHFIGYEINQDYYDVARKRINNNFMK